MTEDGDEGFFEKLRKNKLKKSQERTLRSAALKEQQQHEFAEESVVQKRAMVRQVVGSLTVSDIVAINLCPQGRRNPYFYLAFEGTRHKTTRKEKFHPLQEVNKLQSQLQMRSFPYRYGKELFYWEESFSFPVTDIAADLSVDLYASKPVGAVIASRTDICVGKVIFPLSHLIDSSGVSWTSKNTTRTCEGWFELYPLPAGHLCYTPVVKGLPDTGLPRPEKLLGRVFFKVKLTLEPSVLYCYSLATPYRPIVKKVPEKADPKYIKGAANRIKYLFSGPPYFIHCLQKARSWESPVVSITTLCLHGFMCYCVEWWQLPFLIALGTVVLGYLSRGTQKREAIQIYNDEIEKDPDLPDTIMKKFKVLGKLLTAIQKSSNAFASSVERLFNSVNWTDERVSCAVSLLLLIAGVIATGLAKILDYVITAIALPNFVFILGCIALSPPSLRLKVSRETSDQEAKTPVVLKGIRNLLSRIPDENEVVHRQIAKEQQIETFVD